MTMDGPISAGEMEGQARIRHADALELISGVHKAVIEEAWEAYEKARAASQLLYEEESAELAESLNETLAVIAAGPGDPGPVPENEPSPAPEPVDLGDGWTARPFVDVHGPGIDPIDDPLGADQDDLRDLVSGLTTVGHALARSWGEEKAITDGLEALMEVIEAQGDDITALWDGVIAMRQKEGGNNEID